MEIMLHRYSRIGCCRTLRPPWVPSRPSAAAARLYTTLAAAAREGGRPPRGRMQPRQRGAVCISWCTPARSYYAPGGSSSSGSGSGHDGGSKDGGSGAGGGGASASATSGGEDHSKSAKKVKVTTRRKRPVVKKVIRKGKKSTTGGSSSSSSGGGGGGGGSSGSSGSAAASSGGSGSGSGSGSSDAKHGGSHAQGGGGSGSGGSGATPQHKKKVNVKKIKKVTLKRKQTAKKGATASPAGGGGGSNATAGSSDTAASSAEPPRDKVGSKKKKKKSKSQPPQQLLQKKKQQQQKQRRQQRSKKKVRVCVLASSYENSDSVTAAVDNYWCSPQHYVKKNKNLYSFKDVAVKKIDSYRTVRELVTSGKYDIFFNLCDGGRDEKRAGVDVVQALEEMNAAFTGSDSHSFEPSKIDMKLMVGSSGVRVPNFVLLENAESLAKKCRHLRFPVIVKHLSGYASVGIHKDNRCENLDQLKTKVARFVKEFNHALVEEFIVGREGTVLACADTQSPHGVKVFRPLMFHFLENGDDFAYFDKKWTMECNDKAYGFLPAEDPAYSGIIDMARNAYRNIMSCVGYGRVDFRIDEKNGEPVFLEINPNCGMWYSEKDGGDFADVMVKGDPTWDHERFLQNAITRALREQAARKPWYFISHDKHGQFSTRASRNVPTGKCLFGDAVHPIPVVARALFKVGEESPSVGCVVCRGDGIHEAVAIRHSCEPNMQFVHGRTLLFAAKRNINVGEELTVDYATLRDESMPHFACGCGTKNCRSVIFAVPAMPRTVEVKAMRKMLREKKRVWMKEKVDREAEQLLKKKSASGGSGGAHKS